MAGNDNCLTLAELADFAAELWLREGGKTVKRFLALAADTLSDAARVVCLEALGGLPDDSENHARLLREAVMRRDWLGVVHGLNRHDPITFQFLERAFPEMSQSERALYFRYVWRHNVPSLGAPPQASCLRLLQQAVELREAVPQSERVQLYRGAYTSSWNIACRLVRDGMSWTLERDVALRFATPNFIDEIGCIGSVTVPSGQILAYLANQDENDENEEHECIVDPSTLPPVQYERIKRRPAGYHTAVWKR